MNSSFVNSNGTLISSEGPSLFADNRSYKYGDGLFESMKFSGGKILRAKEHYERLLLGVEVLKMNRPPAFSLSFFIEEIQKLIFANKLLNANIRFQIYRKSGKFYMPDSNDLIFLIEASHWDDELFVLNKTGLKTEIFTEFNKSKNRFSNFKTCNALGSVMAALYAKENGFDECLLINSDGNIAESSNSNVFIKHKNTILTPPLSDGCVEGVMRNKVISILNDLGIANEEKTISPEMLLEADELFITSAMRGARWIQSFRGIEYKKDTAEKLVNVLNSEISSS